MLHRRPSTTCERNPDDVKTKLVRRGAVSIHPTLGHFGDLSLLRPGDGLERTAEDGAATRFHFDKCYNRTLANDEVDLEPAHPEAVSHHSVTHPFQEPLR